MLPEISKWFFLPAPPIYIQDTYISDKHLEHALFYRHETSESEFVNLKNQRFFFVYLVL